ncbi:ATP/GTP-binding protein [Campylobacter fetus]|uniref:ATP/GTP-binding protein n=3 Tax=Campylobacter fetus TaxID=196 RepID=A0A5L4XXK1_CAMFE|nr:MULTISPECIES: hypothetical protein [Campylobacter]OCS21754.1 ATP/GTP-binding protein [Campylobacter fetus subsp. venerealis cfvi97/532]OCS25986.1 ATP/GTP-binding protein [Campylobacter fetus subsp. venerealis cfvB10]OCS29345.1 ATP/GTP-binding protein [Campylobacter fetus subsp. venerealis LMG 6570 = CCUG 33900]OCS42822.1 ATP/GTP-binding protein [Campylobacter fetus subsp. venerealis cfvi02/298]ABK82116.1 putative ATP/GTP-binding protein [Campylobacter fetus subsp. fetus 82-40]
MTTQNYANASYNNFAFNFKTSSGDSINLSLYDNKKLNYSSQKDGSSSSKELTLSHQYGYKFEFNSNGLSEQDRAEIAQAMEDLKPKLEDFMKKIKENEPFSDDTITNLANSLKKDLPNVKSENQKNAVSSSLLDLFDNIITKNTDNNVLDKNILYPANKLFEEMLKQMERFSIYA